MYILCTEETTRTPHKMARCTVISRCGNGACACCLAATGCTATLLVFEQRYFERMAAPDTQYYVSLQDMVPTPACACSLLTSTTGQPSCSLNGSWVLPSRLTFQKSNASPLLGLKPTLFCRAEAGSTCPMHGNRYLHNTC